MPKIADITHKVRSKNAGPFVLTIDLFCNSREDYQAVCAALPTERIAALYRSCNSDIKRYELPSLKVLKFSMPRPAVQGSLDDRDMHASQWAWILAELDLNF